MERVAAGAKENNVLSESHQEEARYDSSFLDKIVMK